MATISRLIVQVGADTAQLKSGLERGVGFLRQFAKTTSQLSNKSPLFGNIRTGDVEREAKRTATAVLHSLDTQFSQGASQIRQDFASRLFSQNEFTARSRQLNIGFNDALRREIDALGAQGLLTPQVFAGMVSQFKDLGDQAGRAMRDQLANRLQLQQDIGKRLTQTVTLPIVAGFAVAVKSAADFENKMVRVGALLEATRFDFVALNAAASDFETVGKFGATASQAAEGMQILAQAGFKVNEVMEINKTVLKLAAVESTDLATAAQIATNVMSSFRIGADGAAGAADVLAKASIDSKATLTDLGVSFTYVGGVARSVGLDLNETTAALALMAEEGFRGTLSGTALRGAILKLTRPTKEQARILQELNVKTVDASGKLLHLSTIVKQFETAEKSFGAFKVGAAALQLFGQRAGPGFGALIRQGSAKLLEFENNLKNAGGTLDRIANQQMNTLIGAFHQLVASLQLVAVSLGRAGIIRILADFLRSVGGMIRGIQTLNPFLIRMGVAFGILVASIGPLIAGLATLRLALFAFTGSAIGLGSLLTPGGIILLGLGLLAAAIALVITTSQRGNEALEDFKAALGFLNTKELQATKDTQLKAYNKELVRRNALTKNLNQELAKGVQFNKADQIVDSPQAASIRAKITALNESIRGYEGRLKALNVVLGSTAQQQAAMKNAARDSLDVMRELAAQMEEGLLAGTELNKKTLVEMLMEQMDLAIAKFGALKEAGQSSISGILQGQRFGAAAQLAELTKVGDLYSEIIARVRQKIALNTVDLKDLQILADAAEKYKKALNFKDLEISKPQLDLVPLFNSPDITEGIKKLQDVADRYRSLNAQITLAKTNGQEGLVDTLETRRKELFKVVTSLRDALLVLVNKSSISDPAILDITKQLNDILQDTGAQLDDQNEKLSQSQKNIQNIVKTWRQLTKIFKNLDFIDEFAKATIDSVGIAVQGIRELGKALADAKKNGGKIDVIAEISTVGSIVGAGVGFFGGLLKMANADNAIIKQNSDALLSLKSSLDKSLEVKGAGGQSQVLAFLSQLKVTSVGIRDNNTGKFDVDGNDKEGVRFLRDAAKAFGVTLEQIQAIAKQNGITIIKDGKLVTRALEQLEQSIRITAEVLKTFSKDMDTQRTLLETKQRLQGIEQTPGQDLQNSLTILASAAPALAAFIGDIGDVTTEGTAKLRERLLALVTAIEEKQIDFGDFGQFGGADAFLEFINKLLDSMDGLADATDSATNSMLNVPTGFKIERARFDAQFTKNQDKLFKDKSAVPGANIDPIGLGTAVGDPLKGMLDILGKMTKSSAPDLIAGLGAIEEAVRSLTSGNSGTDSGDFAAGGDTIINVYVGKEDVATQKNANALADKIVHRLGRRAAARGKPTNQWGR